MLRSPRGPAPRATASRVVPAARLDVLFPSYPFLFFFLPAVLVGYRLLPERGRNGFLAAASYVFYGYWSPWFVLLLLFSTVLDYRCGLVISRSTDPRARRLALRISLVGNLSLLGFFKYAYFFGENLNGALRFSGRPELSLPAIVLPVGISFFTFQSMSYSLDLYRGQARPARDWLDFATYVALFPQLVAGPIVRYRELAEQLVSRSDSADRIVRGLAIFSVGLSKKVLLANHLAPIADQAFSLDQPPAATAWIGVLAYALQIYFDFSGYSDMAIGLALCFGFVLPQNFDAPYRSASITEFWRRWHQSLSRWLRDYLYIPLGGNRQGEWKTYRNLFLTMLLGGLWHGANWTFVAWGGLHGLLLAVERAGGKRPIYSFAPRPIRVVATFVLVLVTWVFFRAENLEAAGRYLLAMAGAAASPPPGIARVVEALLLEPFSIAVLLVGLALAWTPWRTQDLLPPEPEERPRQLVVWAAAALFWISVLELSVQGYNPFLYFQF